MKAHHLNCGTMHPPAGPAMVCHCLLVETGDHLTLIDSGFGTGEADLGTISTVLRLMSGPVLDPAETAINQVRRLGHDPRDVRHIVVTHLDPDHAGGLRDFPWATVHLHATELSAATHPRRSERGRYRSAQWAHRPHWASYPDAGEPWFGLSARPLDGVPGIALIPLAGHSRGHSAVAVSAGDGWLLHAGDAYWFHGEAPRDHMYSARHSAPELTGPHCPWPLAAAQRILASDHRQRLANLALLRDLPPQVRVFSAHDALEFSRF